MVKIIILFLVVIFFAINMGGSGIAPSFAATYCSNILTKKKAILLFGFFVVVGAVFLGYNVTKTLGGGILPGRYFDINIVLIVLFSASFGLFFANILKIPQSTSWTTVFSIVGSGLAIGNINFTKFILIVPFWILLPVVSYFLTLFVHKIIYPPKFNNLWLYEKFFANEKALKKLSIIASCYVAFAIGSNNVANAVGPLVAAGIIKNSTLGLFAVGLIFIVGAGIIGKNTMRTVGQEVVPFGLISATLTNFITATLLIFASIMGIPQSLVQLNAASIFAISHSKNGFYHTASHKTTRKIFFVWLVSPVIAFVSSFFLTGAIKWF
ncbi:MAG: inorganic phosphate transporter [Elusimicrobia bacterium]|nr:inorganic phosphate transporter [Elusimicrobiota bacterium]